MRVHLMINRSRAVMKFETHGPRFLKTISAAAMVLAVVVAAPAYSGVVGVSASSHTISHDSGFGPTDSFGPAAIPLAYPDPLSTIRC
jgi:hypothetical protein